MREVHRILVGLVLESEGVHTSVLEPLAYEVDRKAIETHGYKATSVQYIKTFNGPSSKKIQNAIEDLLEEDVLRKADDDRMYKIDYYSKAEEIYNNSKSESKDAVSLAVEINNENKPKEVLSHIQGHSPVNNTNKYGAIDLRNRNQTTL